MKTNKKLHRFGSRFVLMSGLLALSLTSSNAEEVRLNFSYNPGTGGILQIYPLSETKPSHVKKLPDKVDNPKYTTIFFGPQKEKKSFCLVANEFKGPTSLVWFDANGNGDLSDDPPVAWKKKHTVEIEGKEVDVYKVDAVIDVTIGGTKLSIPRDLTYRDDGSEDLTCCVNYSWDGEIRLGDRSFSVRLTDNGCGDFSSSKAGIEIDFNQDGAIGGGQSERIKANTPFSFGGKTYEIRDVHPSGSSFQLVSSTKNAEEIRPAPILRAGLPFVPFETERLGGGKIKFPEDYKGKGKLVLLEFWATWCGPCVAKTPDLKKAHERFHDQGLEILAVCLDSAENQGRVESFIKSNGVPWTQAFDGKAMNGTVARAYDISAIPKMLLVDPDTGLIVDSSPGRRNMEKNLESALSKKGKK